MKRIDFWGSKKVLVTEIHELLDIHLYEILKGRSRKELIKSLYFKEHILINKVFLNIL